MSFQTFLEQQREKYHLKGVIMGVSINNKHVDITAAGNSMTTVPATPDMHFRIGGLTIAIYATICLILIDKGLLSLNTTVAQFLPKVPNGENITLRMLMDMTANIPDYFNVPEVNGIITNKPFTQWTHKEILHLIYNLTPLPFPAGSRFNGDGHVTNTFLLVTILQLRTKTTVQKLLHKYIFGPLKLKNTEYTTDQLLKFPVFHCFDNGRIPNFEEATYWNSSWGGYATSVNSNTYDVNIIGRAIGTGQFISPELFRLQLLPPPNIPLTDYYFGLGVILGTFGLVPATRDNVPFPITHINARFDGYQSIWTYYREYGICLNFAVNMVDQYSSFSTSNLVQNFFETYSPREIISMLRCDTCH